MAARQRDWYSVSVDTVRLAAHNLRANFPEARAFDRKQKKK